MLRLSRLQTAFAHALVFYHALLLYTTMPCMHPGIHMLFVLGIRFRLSFHALRTLGDGACCIGIADLINPMECGVN
jgi:hypothetical protein